MNLAHIAQARSFAKEKSRELIDGIFKIIFLKTGLRVLSSRIFCVDNCDRRASRSRLYIAKIVDSCNLRTQSYGIYEVSIKNESVLDLAQLKRIGGQVDGQVSIGKLFSLLHIQIFIY